MKPHCGRCAKDGYDCVYSSAVALVSGPGKEPALNLRFAQFFLGLETLGPMLGIDTSSVGQGTYRILRHWEQHSAMSFGAPHMQTAMRKWGFDLASKAPFLLHAMCAFSALHLKHLQGNEDVDLDRLWNHHFRLGLGRYTSELSNSVGPQNMDAVFAGCMLFAMMAYATSYQDDSLQSSTSFLNMSSPAALTWLTSQVGFLVLKSTATIQPHLSESVWHELLGESDAQGAELEIPLRTHDVPEEWRSVCQIHEHSTSDNNPYYDALKLLLTTKDIDASKPENFSHFICFPGRMKPQFKELVKNKDPVALLILSHWLAKMCEMGQWWSKRRVQSECRAICRHLEKECRTDPLVQVLLETPRRACGYCSGQ